MALLVEERMSGRQPERVVLIGASVRAAAFSALRAGIVPWCLDLFADADLSAVAETQRCRFENYPDGFAGLLNNAPPGPIIYTGGLENYPYLIEKIAEARTIWGNDASALRRSRDPFFLTQLWKQNGLRSPAVWRAGSAHNIETGEPGTLVPGEFEAPETNEAGEPIVLKKPLLSAGGANISFDGCGDAESFYFQQFIPGPSYSAVFCAVADRISLLGITEQLVGETWLGAKPFHYCGSIGPVQLSSNARDALLRFGEVLRTDCGLRGLFGIDFILNDDYPWPVEVNPRYTASIEVLEYATGLKAIEQHCRAFGRVADDLNCTNTSIRPDRCVGKAILFAASRFVFPDVPFLTKPPDPFTLPDFADMPNPGEVIETGWPILTVLAEAANLADCRLALQKRAREFSLLTPHNSVLPA